ncbi:hypothetical protein PRIPAC_91827 [Pristionchus pacificus]|uniref:Uncharacterized protein n=1 Tax=Pristionchus pacificus TaxID=54126 RepID=A0A454XRE2_PRIPA|nr:hypothetical protein PRIPAC_91827 [Pristionchus pacificus]|eukprot:PDM68313.1 hypothetical protein PRIPAC_46357 [Pristionchus pacificus]
MMNEKNDYFRFPLALCPSEKSLTSTFGTWEAHGRLRPIASALKGRGRPRKTVSSNAPNSKTRKRIIAVDDIVVGRTEAEAGDDLAKNSWDTITNVTNDKEGYDDEDEEEETILVNRQDDEEIMMCMIQEGFNDVFYH